MAYSEYLADRVRPRLKGKGELEEKKMMGGLIFMVNGKMCLGIMFDKKSEEDKLMVRVGKLNYEVLLTKTGSKPMDFTGKPLRGFLFVGPDGIDAEDDLDFWVEKALEFNRLLNQ
ncbi:TfoX/Sxy family protein [Maribacter hydrothermalis]|uniref:RNA methyltransferase n=1 Tax=Maribacter hydrothermalis TaxID=1836467 RepID=A0A1B7ZCC1_9FLAO|nr:TfoX/Sxy family protein [Maribacter hydrothermalis]APQ18008.1 RNA methyltransferase [Maribacter hydrothermalis]OBR40549.1 RNA methyltransferase [Maribacter hydrothermalis]